ncbi:MAG TPA: methyltransferase [Burkholderiales bacterium]|nr:methyltransferase [Burkholderiales bacterium]
MSHVRKWESLLASLGAEDAILLSVSPFDPGGNHRVYRHRDMIIKVVMDRPGESDNHIWRRTLEEEFSILAASRDISAVPEPIAFKKNGAASILVQRYVDGEDISSMIERRRALPLKLLLLDLPLVLFRLSTKHICHNDLVPRNILVSGLGNLYLIDFDQAEQTSIIEALLRNVGLLKRGHVNNSLFTLFKSAAKARLGPERTNQLRRLLHKKNSNHAGIPPLPANSSPRLRKLNEAWHIAKDSHASYPGVPLAYYSLTVDDFHFPGERPWKERWAVLRTLADYDGKRILELGCNMGLLSCFLLREEHAAAALAVDVDAEILQAAGHVADAFDVQPTYLQVDLDDPAPWESQLRPFAPDIVFALNVLNWVKDRDRLLRFLGECREVVFEGHESFDVEKARFEAVGFSHIRLMAMTERKRPLMICQK